MTSARRCECFFFPIHSGLSCKLLNDGHTQRTLFYQRMFVPINNVFKHCRNKLFDDLHRARTGESPLHAKKKKM